jgi:hypothetical protein
VLGETKIESGGASGAAPASEAAGDSGARHEDGGGQIHENGLCEQGSAHESTQASGAQEDLSEKKSGTS